MNQDEKIKRIASISPETSIHTLLEELLPEMGYHDVKVTHERGNVPENGKDVVASLYDEIEDRKDWTAFVVKKGDIKGTSSGVKDVQDQVNDCFQYEYKSVINKLRFRVSKVKVVCSGNISSGAETKILQNNHFDKANISFWDKSKLVKFIDKYYPSYWLEGSKIYKDYIDRFYEKIESDSKLKAIGTSDEKIQKIIRCFISPRITERIEMDNGTVTNRSREISYLVSQEGISYVTGEAGTGKSTLLKRISRSVIEQNAIRNNSEFYPVLIDAIDIKLASFDLVKALKRYFKQPWTKDLGISVDEIIQNSNFILFIDALDEVADEAERTKVVEVISLFNQNHPRIRVIVTSRPTSVFDKSIVFSNSNHYRLRNLNLHQVQEFIQNYFSENEIKSQRLRKSLQESGILDKLPKTPLSLALITILYDDNEIEIPATITDLYSHFTDVLLEKNIVKKTIDIIEYSIKHRIICLLAYHLHTNKTDRISQSTFEGIINEYNKSRNRNVNSKKVVNLLTKKSGILFKSKSSNISFKHLSFQEYFTAYEFFHYRKDSEDQLVNNFNNEWWQNVSIFYGGMNKDAPAFLDKIAALDISTDIRKNMLQVAGMGKLLQAVYNTPAANKINGLTNSVDNVESVIAKLDEAAEELSGHPIAYLSRFAITQVVYFYFASSHNSITIFETIEQLYEKFSNELNDSSDNVQSLLLERKLFALILASVGIDKENLNLLPKFTEQRKTNDTLLTASTYSFFKYEYDTYPKHIRRSAKMKKLSKQMTKSIRKLNMTDELTKSLKSLAGKENIFEEE